MTEVAILIGIYATIGSAAGANHAMGVGFSSTPKNTHRKAATLVLSWPIILSRAAVEGLGEYRADSQDRRLDRMRKESKRLDDDIRRLEGCDQ